MCECDHFVKEQGEKTGVSEKGYWRNVTLQSRMQAFCQCMQSFARERKHFASVCKVLLENANILPVYVKFC